MRKGGEYILKNPFKGMFARSQTTRSPSASPPRTGEAKPKTETFPNSFLSWAYIPRKFEEVRQLDITKFKYYTVNDLLDLLRHNHPETSFAIWQFLRVANSGVSFDAKKVTSGDHSDSGQRVLDKLIWNLNHPPVSNGFTQARNINLIAGQLLLNVMMRGGAGLELVLNSQGKMDRLQVFDTGTLYFSNEENRLVPYQRQSKPGSTGYTKIDYPTIFYQPLDPSPDDPYGASPLVSLIQVVAWQIGFLADLQAAVHQTGYPRMYAKLLEEVAIKNMPAHIQNDPAGQIAWMNSIRTDVEGMLQNLEPDSIPVFWDSLDLGLVGKGGGGQVIKVDAVIETLNKSLAAALKCLSAIIGLGTNTSKESYAAELKLYSRGIESIQQVVENILERALTMALNLEGVRGWVDVSFKPVDLRSDYQIIAEVQTYQDVLYAARDEGDISDKERTKLMRKKLDLVGEPDDWEALQEERRRNRENGSNPQRRHGSPPATQ